MVKLRSNRSTQSQDQSPFLPQTQSQTQSQTEPNGHGHRPRLIFDSPEKTEEWLASREKTDYTYSRSASYTITGSASGYQVPIMSRVSQGSYLHARDTGSPGGRGLLQQEVTGSPNRRSSRLAQKSTLNESSLVSRISQSQTRSVQVSRNASHTNTTLETGAAHDRYDNESASGEESVWTSSSTMSSSMSHLAHGSGLTTRSGMYHQVPHSSSRQHSISHMYGLDAHDESEISDTESSSAVTSGVSSRASGGYGSIDHARHSHHARHAHHTHSSSIFFLPISFVLTFMTSVVSAVTTVTRTAFSYFSRVVYGSSVGSASAMATDSALSTIASVCSSCVQLASLAVYRCVTYLMCMDVWWLIFTKRTTLGLFGFFGSLLGLGSASQADRAAAAATSAALLEKKRRRRSCCLCLLLLLGTLASSYLLLAAAPFLLAAVSRNETKAASPLHTINQQFGLLLGKLGSVPSDDKDGAAFVAGAGCLQCLKQDDLMGLIGVMVKDQLGDLQSEVASQKQLILAMQQIRTDQETQINNLQDQMGLLIAQRGQPGDRTLLYINTIEGQLTRVRGQLRNLQLSRLRGYRDAERDEVEGAVIVVGLSDDVKTLANEVASLQTDLEDFHAQQVLAADRVQREGDHVRGDFQALHLTMLSWQERLAMNVTFMEAKLKGLANDVEMLKSDKEQSDGKLGELVERINSFEVGLVDVKTEVRSLKSDFGDLLALWDKRENEEAAALSSSLDLLRTDVASLRVSHGDTLTSLNELQNKYQTLIGSLNGVQADFGNLQASVADLGTRQIGAMTSNMEQLNAKLAKLDADLSSLQADFLTLQDSASGKIDKSGLDSLHVSVTQTEEQLNIFITDIDSLKIHVSQLRSQLDDTRTSHEEHRSQAGQALRDLKAELGELSVKSERMVVLESSQGSADSNSLVKQLSEELGAVRLDLRRMSSLDGGSDLVSKVTDLRSALTSAKSQINYLDTTQMQMTRTFTSILSDLRDGVAQVNRAAEDQRSAISSLNASVVSLQQGQDKLSTFVTQKQLEDLKIEMTNMKATIAELSTALSAFASTGDVSSLKMQIANVKSQIDATQVHLAEMSNTYTSDAASYAALAADLAKMQGTVKQLEAMLYNADHQPINLSLLESRIGSLASVVSDNDDNLAAILAMGDARPSTGSNDAIVALQQELAAVRSDTDRLTGLLYLQGEDGGPTNAFAALLDRTAVLEASAVQMKASGVGAGGGYDVRFQKLQGDINNLREDMMRQEAQYSAGGGLGVLGAALLGDMKEAKKNISNLQVDVYKCCKNKTGLLGWWSSPWFGQGQGSTGGNANLSVGARIDEEVVRHIILSALNMYSADKTGMVDYALESAGGSVISTRCSETHYSKTALLSIFGIPLWYMANSPRTVIQPDVQPGNCWAFKGTQGYIVIKLAGVIKPSAFSMEHIPKSLSPTGTIDSAPKEFSVWGVADEEDTEATLLGEYVYDQEGSPLQFFAIEKGDVEPVPAVELKIHSNHGNLEYTCLYRFRVHGTLDRR